MLNSEQADSFLQKRHTVKYICLVAIQCRMYIDLSMCSSVWILEHCQCAAFPRMPHWPIKMSEDRHLEDPREKMLVLARDLMGIGPLVCICAISSAVS